MGKPVLAAVRDGLSNLVSGLGLIGKDKRVSDQFIFSIMDRGQLEAAYRGDWVARKAIDIPAQDATRAWRTWEIDGDDVDKLEEEERRLNIRAKVRKALIQARLYGGSGIILGTGDADYKAPLDVEKIGAGGLKYAHVLPKQYLGAQEPIRDPGSPWFGEPRMYQLSLNTGDARQFEVHPSRVVRFQGSELPDDALMTDGWGDSVLQAIYDAVHNAALAQESVSSLLHEAKIDVMSIPDLMTNIATDEYEQRLLRRFTVAQLAKSTHNTLLMDANEKWEQRQLNFTGLPDLARAFLGFACGAADIPVVRFLGESPAGLNATGASDIRNYYDSVSGKQESDLRPAMSRLDEATIRSALGTKPDGIWYCWDPLWQMTEQEVAALAKTKAETTQVYVSTALIPSEALAKGVQNQLDEDGTYPGLAEAIEEAEKALALEPLPGADPAQVDPNNPQQPAANGQQQPRRAANDPGQPAPAARAANDAAPRTLYVSRKVQNAAEIIAWAKGQGFETTQPAAEMHVTIAFSRQPVDWMEAGQAWGEKDGSLAIPPGGPRLVEKLGSDGATVLLFGSSELSWRHEDIKRASGASWDYESYQPHVTISYQAGEMDLTKVEPYRGAIILGPEIFAEIVPGAAETVTEE
jgi:phage-related protein (TIGR01555 family)